MHQCMIDVRMIPISVRLLLFSHWVKNDDARLPFLLHPVS